MSHPESGLPAEIESQVRTILRDEGSSSPRLAEILRLYPQCTAWLEQTVHKHANEPLRSKQASEPLESVHSELPMQLELRLVDSVAGGGQLRKSDLTKIIEDNPKRLRDIRDWIERFSGRDTTAAAQFRRIHHYLLLRELGRGAFGMVFLAWDSKLDRWVAIKVMRGGWLADEDVRVRFGREAKALARLNHPGIVPLYDVGEWEGTPFFTTELVRGLSLDRVVRGLVETGIAPTDLATSNLAEVLATAGTNPQLGVEGSYTDMVCRIGIQVAAALTASHQTGILHRDVKPSNIMLTKDGEVRVFDFGLAQVRTEQTLTRSGDVLGTPVYLAPELLLGTGRVSEGSDVYALGVTLYELLALRPPYVANGFEQLCRIVRANEPSRLRRHNPHIGRDLEEIVHKAIEKDPRQRYSTPKELSDDLAAYLRRDPVRIGRSRWLRHATRRLQQQGRRIAIGFVVAALAILPAMYLLGQLTQAGANSVIGALASPVMQESANLEDFLVRAESFEGHHRQQIESLVSQHRESMLVLEEVRRAATDKSPQDLAALRRRVEGIHAGYVSEAKQILDRLDEGAPLDSKEELRSQNAGLRADLLRLRASQESLKAERARLTRSLADAEWAYAAMSGSLAQAEAFLAGVGALRPEAVSPTDPLGFASWLEPRQLDERFTPEQMTVPFGGSERPRAPNLRGAAHAEAIDAGLQWLKNHQDFDGKWDCDQFMKHDDPQSDGAGSAVHDVGVTGLALLAFLSTGNTMRVGAYKEQVRKSVMWLREQQDHRTGLFGTNAARDFIYDHAIAAYAMCEAYGMSESKLLRRSAQLGINYLESHRNPYSVWRYQARDNDNDTSVTGWCILGYCSAVRFGLSVNKDALRLSGMWLEQVSDASGAHGYSRAGEGDARLGVNGVTFATREGAHGERFPSEKGAAMTAVGLCCRFELGQDPKVHPVMVRAAERIASRPPMWDERAGSIDAHYWYFGSRALVRVGGGQWEQWRKKLQSAVAMNQHRDKSLQHLYGSWDPKDVWGEFGGRVATTAFLTMTLATDPGARNR